MRMAEPQLAIYVPLLLCTDFYALASMHDDAVAGILRPWLPRLHRSPTWIYSMLLL